MASRRRLCRILGHLSPGDSHAHHLQPPQIELLQLSSSVYEMEIPNGELVDIIQDNDDVASSGQSSCETSLEKKNQEDEEECIFCMIIRGESPAFKLYEDGICICILDMRPLSQGHSLLIPKSHFSSLKETPPSIVAAMCSIVPMISDALMKATKSDAFNLVVNTGAAAGQVIFHTHIHIIPRSIHDSLWTSETFRRQPLRTNESTTTLLADRIRGHLSRSLLPPTCTSLLPKHQTCS